MFSLPFLRNQDTSLNQLQHPIFCAYPSLAVSPTTYDGILTKTNPLSPGSSNAGAPMLHHQWSTSTNETTFSLQDELLMSGDFHAMNSKSRRSSDCKFTQTDHQPMITDIQDDDDGGDKDIIENEMEEEGYESPYKRARRVEPVLASSSAMEEDSGSELNNNKTTSTATEIVSDIQTGSNSNYKEIFKEIFMVLARANNSTWSDRKLRRKKETFFDTYAFGGGKKDETIYYGFGAKIEFLDEKVKLIPRFPGRRFFYNDTTITEKFSYILISTVLFERIKLFVLLVVIFLCQHTHVYVIHSVFSPGLLLNEDCLWCGRQWHWWRSVGPKKWKRSWKMLVKKNEQERWYIYISNIS